jgi:phage baseplate assembly protein W
MTLDAETLRNIERTRLRSLVEANLEVADPLHAGDYQLVTPRGHALSKQEYLGSIASGELDYKVFEPASEIAVRGNDTMAILRYRARIAFHDRGPTEPFECWHTDCYEMRDGRWQAVWSQATAVSGD